MKKRLNYNLFQLIFWQFVEYWYYYLGAVLCLFATHFIQSKLPFWASELAVLVEEGKQIETAKFFWLALGIIFFRTGSRLLFFYPARVLQKELRVELLSRLEEAHPTRYKKHNDGQVFQVLMMDMDQLRALIGFALLQVGNVIVALSILVPKLASFNAQLVWALTPLFIAFVLFSIIVSRNHKIFRKVQDTQGDVQNIIIESYAGKKTIKNFHAENSFISLFKENSWKELSLFYRGGIGVGISIPLVPLGFGLSLLWGAYIIKTLDLGSSSLILFSGFIFLLLEPMQFVSWIGVVFTRSFSSWQRIKELLFDLQKESEDELALKEKKVDLLNGEILFDLQFWKMNLDLPIKSGEWSILVGKTGHGKSYLLTQIADLLRNKKMNISLVSQAPYLYNDTIYKNIFLGMNPSVEEEERAFELLKLFGLDYLSGGKNELMSLEVGENGRLLSGGQAKRLCLIRSLMSQAEILLWDDPFSSVDLILEKNILQELKNRNELKGKTILMTGHRLSTVKHCHHVIYLDENDGIVEQGTVEQTINEGSRLYEYFKYQMV